MKSHNPMEDMVLTTYSEYDRKERLKRKEAEEREERELDKRRRVVYNRLDDMTEKQCKALCYFTPSEIKRVCDALQLDKYLNFKSFKVESRMGVAMIMYNHSYPHRLCDIAIMFRMSMEETLETLNHTTEVVLKKIRFGLEFDETHFSKSNCDRFSKAISEQGGLQQVVGFINNAETQICCSKADIWGVSSKPSMSHSNCVRLHTITTPDGIISTVCGPYNESRNDMTKLNQNQVVSRIKAHFESLKEDYAIYADESYEVDQAHVLPPFQPPYKPPHDEKSAKKANKSMLRIHKEIDKKFGEKRLRYSACRIQPGMEEDNTGPVRRFAIATLLNNIHTCFNPKTSVFNLNPPTLEEYIDGLMRPKSDNDIFN